ncbi:hypothetical protein [Shewanella cutis]|uniref:Phage protein n=1 Tax=Shewanella cutis TaxID=2766780 RepID=A0ABS9QPX0_9GAMM|nr:hypothetical protein [Shewanella sp. PS-2]MCG9962394.1 hypothetical protein [Shewanella sp. PS-2]
MTKRRVLLDGNGSTKINVEGLGVYVPAIEHDHLKQKLGAEIQQSKDQVQAMQLERSTHVDDIGIDRFTNAMRVKMAYARARGRSGWDDPAQCSGEQLATMLVEHLTKGNYGTFEDVANFAMMLHQRQESPMLLVDAVNAIKASVVNELVAVLNEASENAFDNDYLQEARAMDDAAEIISARAKQIMKIKDVEAA